MPKKTVPLDYSAKNKVLGENIKCYPPGIFVGQMGEVISKPLIDFLLSQKGRAHVYARDRNLNYLTVVDETRRNKNAGKRTNR